MAAPGQKGSFVCFVAGRNKIINTFFGLLHTKVLGLITKAAYFYINTSASELPFIDISTQIRSNSAL